VLCSPAGYFSSRLFLKWADCEINVARAQSVDCLTI